jgi:U3 small nucleolar RNA-associated protein 6
MADRVRTIIEECIPDMHFMVQRKYFTEDEMRLILQNRESFEYALLKPAVSDVDYLRAIDYELSLVTF